MNEPSINLDEKIACVGCTILFSRLETEHWIGGAEAMIAAKTEHVRERFVEAMREEIEKRGWTK
jgi:hypothetical protein